ncbi:hypothetical protein Hanom_Chr12g01077631 [Helianthus anomalus]
MLYPKITINLDLLLNSTDILQLIVKNYLVPIFPQRPNSHLKNRQDEFIPLRRATV